MKHNEFNQLDTVPFSYHLKRFLTAVILVLLLASCAHDQSYVDITLSKMKSPVIVVAKNDYGVYESQRSVTVKDSTGRIVTLRCDCLQSLNRGDTIK